MSKSVLNFARWSPSAGCFECAVAERAAGRRRRQQQQPAVDVVGLQNNALYTLMCPVEVNFSVPIALDGHYGAHY